MVAGHGGGDAEVNAVSQGVGEAGDQADEGLAGSGVGKVD